MTTKTSLPPARATARARCSRVAALAVATLALGWWSAGIAQADVSSFILSPASGPPGTNVSVSGTGCSPGLTLSASDFVLVTAPVLNLTLQVPVAANGSWHGSFAVPPDANAGPAPVTATCVSDALPSLTTVYSPQTFTVTAAPPPTTKPPTTTTPTGGTAPSTSPGTTTPKTGSDGSTPTTRGGPSNSGGGSNPGSTVPTSGGVPASGSKGGGGDKAAAGKTGSGSGVAKGDGATRRAAEARAADLRAPELPIAHLSDSSSLGWLAWTLLIALVIAAVAAPLWLRRLRRRDTDAAAIGDTP